MHACAASGIALLLDPHLCTLYSTATVSLHEYVDLAFLLLISYHAYRHLAKSVLLRCCSLLQGLKPPFLFILNVQVPGTPPLSIVAWWALDAAVIEQHSSSSTSSSSTPTTPATTAVQTPARASRDTSSSSNGTTSAAAVTAVTGAGTDLNGSQQHGEQQQQLQSAIKVDGCSEVADSSGVGSKSTSTAAASSVFVSMLQRYAEIPGAGYCGLERCPSAVSISNTTRVASSSAQECATVLSAVPCGNSGVCCYSIVDSIDACSTQHGVTLSAASIQLLRLYW
jgi:hypothetical protein